jgi:nucleotide-binding universal stress UspA family protein
MLALKRILIPTDFSPPSTVAARQAIALADRFHSEIHIIHVLDSNFAAPNLGEENEEVAATPCRNRDAAQTALDEFLAAEVPANRVKRALLCGDPAAEIVRYARKTQCSLIAMPTRGHGTLRRLLLGSVTAKVLHDAECPVWTGVHAAEVPDVPSQERINVLCAADFSSNNTDALRWAKELAEACGSRLTVVHVLPAVHPSWRPNLERQARKTLTQWMQMEGARGEGWVEFGEVGESIAEAAQRAGAGVVVVGRGAAAGTLGRLRSNCYSIIRESPCPVVSV